jgi:hypothetical protein
MRAAVVVFVVLTSAVLAAQVQQYIGVEQRTHFYRLQPAD